MTLAQFLLPGEAVLYESPGEVYHRRKPYALYVTGGRLLLHAAGRRERVIAEPLSGVDLMQYSEGGLLSNRGRLDIRLPSGPLSLTGAPDTIRAVWRALQTHTHRPAVGAADEEVTLVAPPPPLFDDQTHAPAQVQPLAPDPPRGVGRPPRRAALVVGVVCVAALMSLAAALLVRRMAAPATPEARPEVAAAPTPPPATPSPTPVTLRVFDEVFELEEGSHRAVRFNVPAGLAPARVSGGFRVTSGGAVDFYLMSQGQYERFAAGGEPDVTSVVYREEQWNARVGERLPAGDYYLVFDNYDSDAGAQTIAAEFFVVFD